MSYVYFIKSPSLNAVKIGFSTSNPRKRMRSMQTGCPDELQMIGWYEAPIDDERKWHMAYEEYRIRGEWFRLEGKVADFIASFEEHYWSTCREREEA